jgi:transcriptional regulator with XRE-family HTH domain
MENIEKRLEYFIANQGYNYSQFADLIGVQRSSISHIITGRNKPSYDFLRKMFNAFPELNADWLVMGRGRMFHEADDQVTVDQKETVSDETMETPSRPSEYDRKDKAPPRTEKPVSVRETPVIKVILFYDNGRFEEFQRQVD